MMLGWCERDVFPVGIPLGSWDKLGPLVGTNDGGTERLGSEDGMMLGSWDKLGATEGLEDGLVEKLGPGDGMMLG